MASLGGGSPGKPSPTAAERALAERGAKEWVDYLTRIAPQEEAFLARIRAKPGAAGGLQRILQGEIGAQTAGNEHALVAQQAASGLGPSSGAVRAGLMDAALARASGFASGVPGTVMAPRQRELAGLKRLAAYGRGLADASNTSLANRARAETKDALDALARKQRRSMYLAEGLGTAAGLYAAYR